MLRDNLVGLIEPMLSSAGANPLALRTARKKPSDDRPPCLENPRPEGAELTLTENAPPTFQAEPKQPCVDTFISIGALSETGYASRVASLSTSRHGGGCLDRIRCCSSVARSLSRGNLRLWRSFQLKARAEQCGARRRELRGQPAHQRFGTYKTAVRGRRALPSGFLPASLENNVRRRRHRSSLPGQTTCFCPRATEGIYQRADSFYSSPRTPPNSLKRLVYF